MFRKRWVRRFLYSLAIGLVVAIAGFWWDMHSVRRDGEERLAQVVAEIDRTDPHWRWDDLDAAREPIPDEQNGALLVPKFKAALGKPLEHPTRADGFSDPLDGVLPNRLSDESDFSLIETSLQGTEAAGAVALKFKDRPSGLRRLKLAPDYVSTMLPDTQDTRLVVEWLRLDAERQSHRGHSEAAVVRCLALLNAGRSIGSEPTLISLVVRMACGAMAVGRTERTLGLATKVGPLAELQTELMAESHVDRFAIGARAELAGYEVLFGNLASGTVSLSQLDGKGKNSESIASRIGWWVYAKRLPSDRAYFLETLSVAINATKLPEHEQRKAISSVFRVPEDKRLILSRLFMPDLTKGHAADLRTHAQLRCAGTALAVERFRIARGRWPNALAEIPKDILADVPLDPFDGKPLKYVRRADGVTVYSIGPDETDDGGAIRDQGPNKLPGQDVGFRLYDVDQRGLPPLPRDEPVGERDEP